MTQLDEKKAAVKWSCVKLSSFFFLCDANCDIQVIHQAQVICLVILSEMWDPFPFCRPMNFRDHPILYEILIRNRAKIVCHQKVMELHCIYKQSWHVKCELVHSQNNWLRMELPETMAANLETYFQNSWNSFLNDVHKRNHKHTHDSHA